MKDFPIRHLIYEHLKTHQEITYPELLEYTKRSKNKLVTGNRYLQSDAGEGRHWDWRVFDAQGNVIKAGRAWFKKRLKKPIKETTVFV